MKTLFLKVRQHLKQKRNILNIIFICIIIIIIGYIYFSSPNKEEKMMVDYKNNILSTNLDKKKSEMMIQEYNQKIKIEEDKIPIFDNKVKCFTSQIDRILNSEVVKEGYCDKFEIIDPVEEGNHTSGSSLPDETMKGIQNLSNCRTSQDEDEHLQKKRGGVYAIDIPCEIGKSFDVYAPFFRDTYNVKEVGFDLMMGNYIVLSVGDYWMVFGHTKSDLKKGDIVYAGDTIGFTDISGETENYHLHFELWKRAFNISYKHIIFGTLDRNETYSGDIKSKRGWNLWTY